MANFKKLLNNLPLYKTLFYIVNQFAMSWNAHDNKAVGTVLDWGGGVKICATFLGITLTYNKDTILYMSISVIYKIN